MNVLQCRNGTLKGDLECIFRITRLEDGQPKTHGCVFHAGKEGKDYYNLYPELEGTQSHGARTDGKPEVAVGGQALTTRNMLVYNTSGEVVYQPSNPGDPYKLGEQYSEENLTDHQSGRNFDFRAFEADINPKYHRIDFNVPTKHMLSDTDVGDIMGDENPALVHSGWNVERFDGISSVEVCKSGIYGKFNPENNIVMHTCMKSHVGLPGWINYTNSNEVVPPKDLYIGFATDTEIIQFCEKMFTNSVVCRRVIDAMFEVREGKYCNFWSLLENNFVSQKTKKDFSSRINIESLGTIYRKNSWGVLPNIEPFVKLYNMLDRVEWKVQTTDADGVTSNQVSKIPTEYRAKYKENILNWILNHPMLKKVKLQQEDDLKNEKYRPEERYWYIVPLLRRALKDGTLNKKAMLPEWIVAIVKDKPNPHVKLFNKTVRYQDLSDELKGQFHDAQIMNLDTINSDSKENINRQYPGMRVIKPELPQKQVLSVDQRGGWIQFVELLHLGRKWSMLEIKNAWEHFYPSFDQDEPIIFYEWLEKVAEKPIEPSYSLSKDEFNEIITHNGGTIQNYPSEEIEIIEEGAIYYNLGEGDIALGNGQGARFAQNILDASILDKDDDGDRVIWDSWEDFQATKIPLGNWYETNAKVRNYRECQHESFYMMLAKTRALKADDEFARKHLSEEAYEEAKEASENDIASMDSSLEVGLDEGGFKSLDPSTGEMGYLEDGLEGGIWLGEE